MAIRFSNQILTQLFQGSHGCLLEPSGSVPQPLWTLPALAEKNPPVGTLADPAEGNWGPKHFLLPHLPQPPEATLTAGYSGPWLQLSQSSFYSQDWNHFCLSYSRAGAEP